MDERAKILEVLEAKPFDPDAAATALSGVLPDARIAVGPWFVSAELTTDDPYLAVMVDPCLLARLLRKFAGTSE